MAWQDKLANVWPAATDAQIEAMLANAGGYGFENVLARLRESERQLAALKPKTALERLEGKAADDGSIEAWASYVLDDGRWEGGVVKALLVRIRDGKGKEA